MNLSKREKVLLIVFVSVLVMFLYYRFVYIPETKLIQGLEIEYRNKMNEFIVSNTIKNRIDEVNKQIDEAKKRIEEKMNVSFVPLYMPDVLREIDKSASDNNIMIDNIEFKGDKATLKNIPGDMEPEKTEIVSTSDMDIMTLDFTFSGSYSNCMSFIKYFEQNERIYIVDVFEFIRNGEVYSGSLSLNIYAVSSEYSGQKPLYNTERENPFE